MSSTNKTTNYDLAQFLGTDKPAWLVDYNGDMVKIDTAIKNAADAASAAQSTANGADGKADSLTTDVGALSTTVSAMGTTVSSVQGSVNTINSLIGNGEPTTTDKTLIGAINEINAEVTDIPTIELDIADLKASVLRVDGSVGDLSQLTTTAKTDLVSAINEVAGDTESYTVIDSITELAVTGTSKTATKTFSQLIDAKEVVIVSGTFVYQLRILNIGGGSHEVCFAYEGSAGYDANGKVSVNFTTGAVTLTGEDFPTANSITITSIAYR